MASVSIPFGQRFITIDLTQQANLAFEYPSIYLETVVDPVTTDPEVGSVRAKFYNPIFQLQGTSPINIEQMELYINNIFVNPEVNKSWASESTCKITC